MKTYSLGTSLFVAAACCALLAACDDKAPASAYQTRTPESLLDVAVESVNIPLDKASGLDDLAGWVRQDKPSYATVQCTEHDKLCDVARLTLRKHGIGYRDEVSHGGNQVILVYERVQARDCNQTYMDNVHNQNNLNHAAFGCSVNANMLQMISDKKQFTNPELLAPMDGSKARQVYKEYSAPQDASQQENTSLLSEGSK